MINPLDMFSFPVLGKELIETANRRSTYWFRGIFCAVLFGFFLAVSYTTLFQLAMAAEETSTIIIFTGYGAQLFKYLIFFQYIAILLIIPPIMGGVISDEKEKGSLSLLLISPMTPSRIVLGKYISRLIPIVSFQFLSLPLAAVLYSTGGVSPDILLYHSIVIFMLTIMAGALSIMLSAYCRTTTSSIILSYLMIILLAGALLPFLLRGAYPSLPMFLLITLIVAVSLLFLTRSFLVSRSSLKPFRTGRDLLGRLDTIWEGINSFVCRGLLLEEEDDSLPEDKPVDWRESRRRGLGKGLYILRTLLLLNVPVVAFLLIIMTSMSLTYDEISIVIHYTIMIVWLLMLFAVANTGASAIAHEKSNQTLDVLLTTPLAGHEIIKQKIASANKMLWIYLSPVLSLYIFGAILHSKQDLWIVYCLTLQPCFLYFYLRLVLWFSFWTGLRAKKRVWATLFSLVTIIIIQFLPIIAGPVDYWSLINSQTSAKFSTTFNSGMFGDAPVISYILYRALCLLIYVVTTLKFQRSCFRKSDMLLGRMRRTRKLIYLISIVTFLIVLGFILFLTATSSIQRLFAVAMPLGCIIYYCLYYRPERMSDDSDY